MIIWLTGLSGAGKTTLSNHLADTIPRCFVLDGDDVRTWLTSDLGFSKADRRKNVLRVASVAAQLAKRGMNVVVALISPYEIDRQDALDICRKESDTYLVHVYCPLSVCQERDPKQMYLKAQMGLISNFTGISDPFESPTSPDLRVDTSKETVEESVGRILACCSKG